MENFSTSHQSQVVTSNQLIKDLSSFLSSDNNEESTPIRHSGIKSKSRTKISKETSRLLNDWIISHNEYPYPTAEDLEELTKITNLNERQIRVWFTNYRNDIRNSESRNKVIENAAQEYLQRYFCSCEVNPPAQKTKENTNDHAIASNSSRMQTTDKNNTQHDTNNFSANKMVSFDDDDNCITEPPITKENNRTKIGKSCVNILKNWLRKNEEYPYPLKEDLLTLTKKTKLTEKQIRVWFTNFRNRKFSPEESCISKIKYVVTNKDYKGNKSSKIKEKVINDASIRFLSKYYCQCDAKPSQMEDLHMNKDIMERALKFFKCANYCTCDLEANN